MEIGESDDKLEHDLKKPGPVFLLLLDGWGVAQQSEVNALSLAKTPYILQAIKEYPALVLNSGIGNLNNRYLSLGSGINTDLEDQFIYNDLTAVFANLNLRQLKIFDSERLAPLSYFYNGRREEKLELEDWITITSKSKKLAYDVHISAKKIFQESIEAVKDENYDFIVASCPIIDYMATNGDMATTVEAIEKIDKSVKKLASEILDREGTLIITSVQGNAEKMMDMTTDLPNTKMTDNPLPLIMISNNFKGRSIASQDAPEGDLSLLSPIGSLADIAPSIIDVMGIDEAIKVNFSGQSLLA